MKETTKVNTARTSKRILIAFLNGLTPLVMLAFAFYQSGHQSTIIIEWPIIVAICFYIFVNYIVLVKIYGGTLFHILFNLRVVNLNDDHGLGWLQVTKRLFASHALAIFTHALPYCTMFLNHDRRHLGDIWARTKVIELYPKRKTAAKAPRHILFVVILVIGLAGAIGQIRNYSSYAYGKLGILIEMPSSTSEESAGIGLWPSDKRESFISHCSSISSEYLKMAMQGQETDSDILAQLTGSVDNLCSCVATEVEKSALGALLIDKDFQERVDFELLFEDELFTGAYIQASSTCEALLN